MANYRKSFNLRNGVQIDDDNFIVNANGLVGIGTSSPTEFLDVRGNVKVVGYVTASSTVYSDTLKIAGIATVDTQFKVGSNINLVGSSGSITAVSFYGNGATLSNLPTSQWLDVDVGLGFTSIYPQGYVGISTVDPRFPLQVGSNPNTPGSQGVGFNSNGNIISTGIMTAATFSGSFVGNSVLGFSTVTTTFVVGAGLTTVTINSGVVTASNGFSGTLTGNVVGIASTALSLSGTPNINVGIVTATSLIASASTIGLSTVTNTLHVGTGGTAFAAVVGGRIGVGTASPTSEIQIRKSSGSLLEVISDTGESRISIGQSITVTGVGASTGVIRFGSSNKTFDIINNDTGNLNYYLHGPGAPAGVGTGRFEWIYGQTLAQLMSLTYGGSLGLGKTNPDNTLHVVGTSTVTGNAYFGQNVEIKGTVTAANYNLPGSLNVNINGNVFSDSGISTFNRIQTGSDIVIVSSSSSIGIGTSQPIVALDARDRTGLFAGLGINTTTAPTVGLNVLGGFYSSNVGIGTTLTNRTLGVYGNIDVYPSPGAAAVGIYIYKGEVYADGSSKIGIGTTAARAAVDFSDAGKTFLSGQSSFMIVPRLTSSQRSGLSTSDGAIIYNTTTLDFQGYVGTASSSWTSIDGRQVFRLTSNGASFGPTIGDFYGSNSSVNLAASSVYELEYHAYLLKNTAGTATWTLTASSAPTLISAYYTGSPVTGIGVGIPTTGYTGSQASTTAAFNPTASLTGSPTNHSYVFKAQVITNAATSLKLQLTQSAGVTTALSGSYYTVRRISSNVGLFT